VSNSSIPTDHLQWPLHFSSRQLINPLDNESFSWYQRGIARSLLKRLLLFSA
jgi:hypothetical protein